MTKTKTLRKSDLKDRIRDIPDFPKEGIIFKDITTLLKDAEAFKKSVNLLAGKFKRERIDYVVGVESRGFIFGGALAYKLGAGFVPVRKKGKLQHKTYKASYSLEYGEDTLEIHQDAIKPGARVLLIDDLLATGGTLGAVIDLVKKLKGEIVEIAFIIELKDLKGRSRLKDFPVYSMIQY